MGRTDCVLMFFDNFISCIFYKKKMNEKKFSSTNDIPKGGFRKWAYDIICRDTEKIVEYQVNKN